MKNNKVVGEERLLLDQKERFRDVLNGMDGNLYAVTDSGNYIKFRKIIIKKLPDFKLQRIKSVQFVRSVGEYI
jgi:glucose/arabinose dehydrogenase